MAEHNDNLPLKRTRSITGKLHTAYLLRKIRFYIAEDVLIFILLSLGAMVQQEYILTGSLVWNRMRYFHENPEAESPMTRILYTVADTDGNVLMEAYFFPILQVIGAIVAFLIVTQILSILLSWFSENRRIRRMLQPLTDLAKRAEELNRLSFGEDKYQVIEDAIERMQIDETERLSFGDEDLRGVEAAMNNLLTRMRESNMQQARFVNDASHELRTPIAVIRGYADMLDRWGKNDEKVLEEAITAIRQESEHMGYLVEQLLFLARGDAGKTELQKEPVDLNGFMKEIYEESVMIDEAHPYRFEAYTGTSVSGFSSDTDPSHTADGVTPGADTSLALTAMADKGLLKQAVRILVDNAAKYTAPGDEITLSAGMTESENGAPCAFLQVQDNGCGMQEADVTHIFERFYRSEEVRQQKGTGLGLSIAKWIIDKHGAHFEVLSRTGLGTRIRIVLAESAN